LRLLPLLTFSSAPVPVFPGPPLGSLLPAGLPFDLRFCLPPSRLLIPPNYAPFSWRLESLRFSPPSLLASYAASYWLWLPSLLPSWAPRACSSLTWLALVVPPSSSWFRFSPFLRGLDCSPLLVASPASVLPAAAILHLLAPSRPACRGGFSLRPSSFPCVRCEVPAAFVLLSTPIPALLASPCFVLRPSAPLGPVPLMAWSSFAPARLRLPLVLSRRPLSAPSLTHWSPRLPPRSTWLSLAWWVLAPRHFWCSSVLCSGCATDHSLAFGLPFLPCTYTLSRSRYLIAMPTRSPAPGFPLAPGCLWTWVRLALGTLSAATSLCAGVPFDHAAAVPAVCPTPLHPPTAWRRLDHPQFPVLSS